MTRIALTAGHDRALHAVAIAELLRRRGHEVRTILVVTPFSVKRFRALARQRGRSVGRGLVRKLLGKSESPGRDDVAGLVDREQVVERSLRAWARRHGAHYRSVENLNAPASIAFLRAEKVDGVIYAGGGILRAPFIEAARGRVLNAHAGPLPQIRGMNACEWTILLGGSPAVTIHFIDTGIDTGPALEVIPVPVRAGDDVPALRSRCTATGIEGLVAHAQALEEPIPPSLPSGAQPSRQCFVMAPVIRELLDARLRASRIVPPRGS